MAGIHFFLQKDFSSGIIINKITSKINVLGWLGWTCTLEFAFIQQELKIGVIIFPLGHAKYIPLYAE